MVLSAEELASFIADTAFAYDWKQTKKIFLSWIGLRVGRKN